MPDNFEQWADAELARLRADTEALERTLARYRESKAHERDGSPPLMPEQRVPKARRGAPKVTRVRKGSKRSFVLGQIKEWGQEGASTEDLFSAVQVAFPDMKRSSLRALLYLENKENHIKRRENGRYVLPEHWRMRLNLEEPSAPTPGSSE